MKTMGCKAAKHPLLLERVGMRRIKSSAYIPLIPAFSFMPVGTLEKGRYNLCRYLCPPAGAFPENLN
jgi:hypothetical protein